MLMLPACLRQVCDDSTREDVRRRINDKVAEMCHQGHQCMVTRRDANKGFKVGEGTRQQLRVLPHSGAAPYLAACTLTLNTKQQVVLCLGMC